MKLHSWICAALVCMAACQPKPPKQAQQQETSQDSTWKATTPANYYWLLKGTIAGQPVTMHLIRSGHGTYSGWYCYNKIGDPIALYHTPEDSSAPIVLSEYTDPDMNSFFRGRLNPDGHFTGIWQNGPREFEFDLQEDTAAAIQFEVFSFSDSISLFANTSHSPIGMASASIVWPVGGADDAALQVIRGTLAPAGKDPQLAVREPVDTFLRDYKGNRDDVDTSNMGMSWSWSAQTTARVVWNQYPLLAIEKFDYAFTGGAHGNYGSHFIAIDVAKKKVLTAGDIFQGNWKQPVGQALEKAFRKKYKVPAADPLNKGFLFSKHIVPNDNFFITDKGVVFSYTPYEIASYAMGQITLFVPFSELKGIVKDEYTGKI